jgi:hypothetical protein
MASALTREVVDASGLVIVNVYIPTGTPMGTTADSVVLEENVVLNDPNPSRDALAPFIKSLPVIVIIVSRPNETEFGDTPLIPNAALATDGNAKSSITTVIANNILIYLGGFLFMYLPFTHIR